MITLGRYPTRCGLPARVTRIKSLGTSHYSLWGSILSEGVYYIHCWKEDGKSMTGDKDFDLIAPTREDDKNDVA